jgi:hypothetical protein
VGISDTIKCWMGILDTIRYWASISDTIRYWGGCFRHCLHRFILSFN